MGVYIVFKLMMGVVIVVLAGIIVILITTFGQNLAEELVDNDERREGFSSQNQTNDTRTNYLDSCDQEIPEVGVSVYMIKVKYEDGQVWKTIYAIDNWKRVERFERIARGSFVIIVPDEMNATDSRIFAGVLIVDPERPTTYTVLLPGILHRWGEDLTNDTLMHVEPFYNCCKLRASGVDIITNSGQNYTLVHTNSKLLSTAPAQPARLIETQSNLSNAISLNTNCTMIGFLKITLKLVKFNLKVVECAETFRLIQKQYISKSVLKRGSYFCVETLHDELNGFYAYGTTWLSSFLPKEATWPIFCDNWIHRNNVDDVEAEGGGDYRLAGFVGYFSAINGTAYGVSIFQFPERLIKY